MNNGYADLHIHTTFSDGYLTPKQVVNKARKHNLRAISIVDHDETAAIPVATEYARMLDIEVIPGVELSVSYKHYDLHLLAYGIDYYEPAFVKYLGVFKEARLSRAAKIISKLARLGMPVSLEMVKKKAGNGTIGRPHIANVLLEEGYVYSFQDAFNRFLGNQRPAYVDKYKFDIKPALELIQRCGGVSVVAHPGIQIKIEDLLQLINEGVQGIEIIHPKHSGEMIEDYKRIAADYNLVTTGGSDFHGGAQSGEPFGKYKISYQQVLDLKEHFK